MLFDIKFVFVIGFCFNKNSFVGVGNKFASLQNRRQSSENVNNDNRLRFSEKSVQTLECIKKLTRIYFDVK